MGLYELMANGRVSNDGKMTGVWIGIVTNNSDDNGIVRVNFPWRDIQDECPARITTPMGGKEMGTFFIPEVGDEVLVAFGQGDINDAYIIGTLWNGVDTPPASTDDGKNNIRKIKSRSGHEIIFDDNKEKKTEKIEIHTNSGHSLILDDSEGKEKIELKDKSGSNKIIIDTAKNSITIESDAELKIKSKKVEIESDGEMTIKSGATLTIKGELVKIN